MSIIDSTEAERLALRTAAIQMERATQPFAEDGYLSPEDAALLDPFLEGVSSTMFSAGVDTGGGSAQELREDLANEIDPLKGLNLLGYMNKTAKAVLDAPYIITGRTNIRNPYWGAPTIDPHNPAAAAANSAAINLMLASGNTRHELDDVTRAIDSTLLVPARMELVGAGRGANGLLWIGGDTPIIARANYADMNAAGFSNIRIRDLRITDQRADRTAHWAIDLTNGNSNGLFNCQVDSPLGTLVASKNGIALGTALGSTYTNATFVAALMDTRIVNSKVVMNTTDWTIGGDSQIWSLGRNRSIEAGGGGTIDPGVQIVPGNEAGIYVFSEAGFNVGTLDVQGVFFDGNTVTTNFTGWGIMTAPGIGLDGCIICNNRFWHLNKGGVSLDKLYGSQLHGNVFDNCDSDDTGESDIVILDMYGSNVNNTHKRDSVAPKTGAVRTHTAQAPVVLTGKVAFPTSTVGGEVGFIDVYGDATLNNRSVLQVGGSYKFQLTQTSVPSAIQYRGRTERFANGALSNAAFYSDGSAWHQTSSNRPAQPAGDFNLEGITTSRRVLIVDVTVWTNGPAGATGRCALDAEFSSSGNAVLTLRQLSNGTVYTRSLESTVWQAWVTNSPT